MIRTPFYLALTLSFVVGDALSADKPFVANRTYRMHAAEAALNPATAEIVNDDRLLDQKGVSLKADIPSAVDEARDIPDLTFTVRAPEKNRYVMRTHAVTDAEGAAAMKIAKSKYESLYIKIQIDDQRPTNRVVYVPWDNADQTSGKFFLSGEEQQLKIWLPRGVRLDTVTLTTYHPPKVPDVAAAYQPMVTPPDSHPRLWVNQDTLPKVRQNLERGDHAEVWKKIQKAAAKPFDFQFDPHKEIFHNDKLEKAVELKAFCFLMTGDEKLGKEAIQLMKDYLSHVEFGNLLDITREIGRAIYTGSLVYDWCYPLMSTDDQKVIQENLMRLADDMECGWPPFKQSIVNGHGNEAQVNRDLLSMSIALYGEDKVPYQYTAYRILEQLVPMRRFEYVSPRHNQGIGYGAHRFTWEMHGALLFQRMTGKEVYDPTIKGLPLYWRYMRLPDGQMLKDGDMSTFPPDGKPHYWKSAITMLLCYAYSGDAQVKAEFQRQGGIGDSPLYLLLDDPDLEPNADLTGSPLTIDFGPILGSMVARTGWKMGEGSDVVVAEIKGGGYHFGNHQHADAGAIQLYYRGMQFGDLGVYGFYGIPYDRNFNKRSVAHSMMRILDPNEKIERAELNDGGTRYIQNHPQTPEQAKMNPTFHNGKIVSTSFGPSETKPDFSFFSVNLVGAYSEKISDYTRSYCFLNLGRADIPAAIVLVDDVTAANPDFKKYWQINAFHPPVQTENGVILHNESAGKVGKTHVNMLIPAPKDRELTILNGKEALNVFGNQYETPKPDSAEAQGSRIVISPRQAQAQDKFLTVLQVASGDAAPLPIVQSEFAEGYIISLADRVVVMSKNTNSIQSDFSLTVPEGGDTYHIALTGLAPGNWKILDAQQKVITTENVVAGKNTLFLKAPSGNYTITNH